jgi:hypothetical protein
MTVRNVETVSDIFKRMGISTRLLVKIMHTNGSLNVIEAQFLPVSLYRPTLKHQKESTRC